jgi:hypothetical protein
MVCKLDTALLCSNPMVKDKTSHNNILSILRSLKRREEYWLRVRRPLIREKTKGSCLDVYFLQQKGAPVEHLQNEQTLKMHRPIM